MHNREWDRDRDEARIRAGFAELCRTVTQWPQPMHLITALPPVAQKAIAQQLPQIDPSHRPAAWAEIERLVRSEDARQSPAETLRQISEYVDKPAFSELEAELKQHYADRKTLAAGGE